MSSLYPHNFLATFSHCAREGLTVFSQCSHKVLTIFSHSSHKFLTIPLSGSFLHSLSCPPLCLSALGGYCLIWVVFSWVVGNRLWILCVALSARSPYGVTACQGQQREQGQGYPSSRNHLPPTENIGAEYEVIYPSPGKLNKFNPIPTQRHL